MRAASLSGRLLLVMGYVGVVLGTVGVCALAIEAIRPDVRLGAMAGGALLFLGGRMAILRGRKLILVSSPVAYPSRDDHRAPVLYLRSFQDDPLTARIPPTPRIQTEEEMLTNVLREVGPVTAIGRPGGPLPEVGASRFYVSDAEWQQAVTDLLGRAVLVVARAGATDGLLWELEQIVSHVDPTRLVLLLPFQGDEYETFRARSAIFPHGLPEYFTIRAWARGELDGLSLYALVRFDEDWTPHLVKLDRELRGRLPWYWWSRQIPIETYLRLATRPVLDRLGLAAGEHPLQSRWLRRSAIMKSAFMVAVVGLLLTAIVVAVLAPDAGRAIHRWMTDRGWW